LAVFGVAGANVGHSQYGIPELSGSAPYYLLIRDTEGTTYQARLGLGASYRLSRRWGIEGLVERILTTAPGSVVRYDTRTFTGWQGSVGVSFRLGK
jgi:hypothetical protein